MGIRVSEGFDLEGQKVSNLGAGVEAGDAVNKAQLDQLADEVKGGVQVIGDGSTKVFTLPHGKSTDIVEARLRDKTTGQWVIPSATSDATNVVITFGAAPAENAYDVVFIPHYRA